MKLPNPKFWEGKRVLVTGAEGFKGRWMVQWLSKLGAIVETNETIDICDYEAMKNIIFKFDPEIVIHMAAVSTVQEAFENPMEAIRTNAMGTTTLLQILKIHNMWSSVKAIVNVTTDKVYHVVGAERGCEETDPLGGLEMYAVSKVCSEHISKVYQKTFKLPIVTVRAGNVIGGGDFKRSRIIPNYYFAQLENTPLEINATAIRPWQYILDCLCGYLLLCEKLYNNDAYTGAWNFASNEFESRSVEWIVKEMNKYFDHPIDIARINSRLYYETNTLKLNSRKSHDVLQWTPKYDMQEMVRRTAEWYRNYMMGHSAEALNEFEINAYMNEGQE